LKDKVSGFRFQVSGFRFQENQKQVPLNSASKALWLTLRIISSYLLTTPPCLPLYLLYQPSNNGDKGEELEATASELCKRSVLKASYHYSSDTRSYRI